MRVRELAEWLGATFEGDGEKDITGVAPLDSGRPLLLGRNCDVLYP
jgi:hypothetical protein